MGLWEKGKHLRWLTKEEVEQQQELMIYGQEEMDGDGEEREEDDENELGSREVEFRSDLQIDGMRPSEAAETGTSKP